MSQTFKRLSEADEHLEGHAEGQSPMLSLVPAQEQAAVEKEAETTEQLKKLALIFLIAAVGMGYYRLRTYHEPQAPVDEKAKLHETMISTNREGLEAFYAGHSQQADSLFRKALEIEPQNAALQINLAVALRHEQKSDEALGIFNRILARDPANPSALNGVGRIQLDAGKLDDAEPFFKRALANPIVPVETLLNLGELSEKKGNWNDAVKYYGLYLQSSVSDSVTRKMVSARRQSITAITAASTDKNIEKKE